jgi:hypothetical protein
MRDYVEKLKENFSCPPLGFFIGMGIAFITAGIMELSRLWISIPIIIVGAISISFPFWAHLCMTVKTYYPRENSSKE